jgi:hypothetical protein
LPGDDGYPGRVGEVRIALERAKGQDISVKADVIEAGKVAWIIGHSLDAGNTRAG